MFKEIRFINIFFILLGAAIFSFGIVNINIPNNLAEGGFTGITLLLYFLFSIDPSLSNLLLNIPVFIIGWRLLGKTTLVYTIIGTVSVSIFLAIFQANPIPILLTDDLLLAALFAGVSIGIGLGIVFRFGGTTGGVDIIARLIYKYFGWSMGRTMFMFDAVVITVSLCYLDHREAMYTLVVVFVGSRVIDFMQDTSYAAKGATIISDKSDEITAKILEEMSRGVTTLKGVGSYTKTERDVLYCVVPKNELVHLKNLIVGVDPHAFVTVTDVHDVLGEGFTLDENKEPINK